jgi:transglycosylase-like protein
MRSKTIALALASALVAVPVALAAAADDPPSPTQTALRAPVGGHLTVASQMRAEARENAQQDLIRRAMKRARQIAHVRDTRFAPRAARAQLRGQAPARLRAHLRGLRRELREARRERKLERRERELARREARAPAVSPALEAIAACESGGDPTAIGGGGLYRGKYQFDFGTWQSVGGSGDPAQAPEAEQDRRAAILYARAGASPWPVCGR